MTGAVRRRGEHYDEGRDRQAARSPVARHTTVFDMLAWVSIRPAQAMRRATDSYRRLAAEDPAGFEEYLAEGRVWETATVADGLGSAEGQFPGLNLWSTRPSRGSVGGGNAQRVGECVSAAQPKTTWGRVWKAGRSGRTSR